LKTDYLNDDIDASDYRELKAELDLALIGIQESLVEVESYMGRIPTMDLEMLQRLGQLGPIFEKMGNRDKKELISQLFPEGMKIDKENEKV